MKEIRLFVRSAAILSLLVLATFSQGVPSPYASRLRTFATGLDKPVLIRSANDGSKRLFVVEQSGTIKVFQPGANVASNFLDLSSAITTPAFNGDERGLLGLTFHPQFRSNGRFYVNYTRVDDGATIVAEYTTVTRAGDSDLGDISTERVLLTIPQPFANNNGGMIEFGPDGYLYIGMGDGGSANDPGNRAQDPADLLGKMLRIDVNIPDRSPVPYLIPTTNPFTGPNTARCDGGSTTVGDICQEIWTIGMRNPWRWSFDRGGTHQLWVGDVGQDAIEEVDVISGGGGNYGWRAWEGNRCNTNITGNCPTSVAQTLPLFTYTHSSGRCAITGGYVYRGTQRSLPTGAYVYADQCSGEIWMWQDGQRVQLQNTLLNVVSFGEDEDGEIYVCYSSGRVDKLVRARASTDLDGDLRSDVAVFRPSDQAWYAINSSNNSLMRQSFGLSTDVPTPKDFDGDNIVDIAVFRPSSGIWFIFCSSDNTVSTYHWGTAGDIPAAGDYDGDAKADPTVYRPRAGMWFTLRSSDGMFTATRFGLKGDKPVAGDYDGDGKCDIAVFRDNGSLWFWLNSTNGSFNMFKWGKLDDLPAPGDFDADGRQDLTVYRPSTGEWFVYTSRTNFNYRVVLGGDGDIPVVGDYDGDGKDDVAVFRPGTGVWYGQHTADLSNFEVHWGLPGDLPIEMVPGNEPIETIDTPEMDQSPDR